MLKYQGNQFKNMQCGKSNNKVSRRSISLHGLSIIHSEKLTINNCDLEIICIKIHYPKWNVGMQFVFNSSILR